MFLKQLRQATCLEDAFGSPESIQAAGSLRETRLGPFVLQALRKYCEETSQDADDLEDKARELTQLLCKSRSRFRAAARTQKMRQKAKGDGMFDDDKADHGKADDGKADEGKAGDGKADDGKAVDGKADHGDEFDEAMPGQRATGR